MTEITVGHFFYTQQCFWKFSLNTSCLVGHLVFRKCIEEKKSHFQQLLYFKSQKGSENCYHYQLLSRDRETQKHMDLSANNIGKFFYMDFSLYKPLYGCHVMSGSRVESV